MVVWIILFLTERAGIFPGKALLSMHVTVVCMFCLTVDKATGTLD